MASQIIKESLEKVLKGLSLEWSDSVVIEHPNDLANGDYSTNVALALFSGKRIEKREDLSKVLPKDEAKDISNIAVLSERWGNPKELAEKIVEEINKEKNEYIEKVGVAGPGFINFYLTQKFFVESLEQIIKEGDDFGKNENLAGQKILVEHTQPNPFKEFHVGHLMNNTIGEALTRLLRANGAEVKTATYHGDVGLHVAKTVWAMKKTGKKEFSISEIGQLYADGSNSYEDDADAKQEIVEINKKIYEKSDEEIDKLYDLGRKISLDYFDSVYKKLGSSFDFNFFEGEAGVLGKEIVLKNVGGVFEESEGATIFRGEEYGLHTRVFLNKEKLPTYEAKEVGLAKIKEGKFSFDQSLTITGNEQDSFFKVTEMAIGAVFPNFKGKFKHLSHGMLRLPSGKMSSRTGDVITADSLIANVIDKVREKTEVSDRDIDDKDKLIQEVSLAAIKYSILRQEIGQDVIFDFDKSISFAGDSGPYLQYTYARIQSVLSKSKEQSVKVSTSDSEEAGELERTIYQFPEVIEVASAEYSPHKLLTYLTQLASAFNSYYGNTQILGDKNSPYRLALASSVGQILKNGLNILGIEAPERM